MNMVVNQPNNPGHILVFIYVKEVLLAEFL